MRMKRILAVDDVAVNLSVIEQALRDKYEVITVNSGARALRYLQKERPDLILMDIRMENKDGIETLREIRAMPNGSGIPVIMLTSAQDRNSVLASTKLGVYDYVVKPFIPRDLIFRIETALELAVRDRRDAANRRD